MNGPVFPESTKLDLYDQRTQNHLHEHSGRFKAKKVKSKPGTMNNHTSTTSKKTTSAGQNTRQPHHFENVTMADHQQVTVKFPHAGEQPVYANLPIANQQPVYANIPIADQQPVYANLPIANQQPVYANIPIADQQPVYENNTTVDQQDQCEQSRETKITFATPVSTEFKIKDDVEKKRFFLFAFFIKCIKCFKPLKNFIDNYKKKSYESYNKHLAEYRDNKKDLEKIEYDARFDMRKYVAINERINENGFDKNLLKDKNSDQIARILVEHRIISKNEAKILREDNVDLEGSPFWSQPFVHDNIEASTSNFGTQKSQRKTRKG